MFRKLVAVSLAAILAAYAPSVALAASTVFMDQTPACGTSANGFLCKTLTFADNNKNVTVNAKFFSNPLLGPTLVTWSGTVNCRMTAKTVSPTHFEAEVLVHLQIATSDVAVQPGAIGAASTGFLVTQSVNFIHREATPVTLTRLFKGMIATGLIVRARPVFKTGTGSCAVTGGSFTTTTVR